MKFSFFLCALGFFILSGRAQSIQGQSFATINSPLDEQNPVISPDGKTLYLTIANHPQNAGGKKDPGDIWISLLLGNDWSAPVNAGTVLNDKGYNAVAGFSDDGSQLYLLGHYAKGNEIATSQGIAVSRKTGSGWSSPENIVIPYFKNKSPVLTGHVSKDGNVFVFSAESYNTTGAEDIYVSTRDSRGNWSEARNLGKGINTQLQELSPWLSDNGRVLYFASNGRKGFGSYDIYSSRRLDDSWSAWTPPANLGDKVNTEGRELFYAPALMTSMALFTSTSNSDGYSDIKMHAVDPVPGDSVPVAKNEPGLTQPPVKLEEMKYEKTEGEKNVVTFHGSVLNEKTNQPVTATLTFQSAETLSASSGADGYYQVKIPAIAEYHLMIEAPGYVGRAEKLDVQTLEMKEIQMNFKLQPIEIGTTVNLKNVLFQQSTATLLEESFDELNMVVDFMKLNPAVEIELAGHTDNRGISVHNVNLSQERVDNVKKYLVSKGIEPRRITGKGYGGIKPIADNSAEETRKLNRRVEFVITRK
jgi:OmpA-OmpF porin, OOP family